MKPLSPQELAVSKLIAQGCSNAAIADRLNKSISTVRGQVTSALAKLQLPDRTNLALWYRDTYGKV